MKLTHTIHISDRTYQVDEDAYALLDKCLSEINSDPSLLEENIEDLEHFLISSIDSRIGDRGVIDLELANTIIENLSNENPDSFVPDKVLFRDVHNGMICGVFSGLSRYSGLSVVLLRSIAVVLTLVLTILFNMGWIIGAAYIAFWMIVPPAYTATEILRMKGLPITIRNIGMCVYEEAKEKRKKPSKISQLLGCLFKGILVVTVLIGFLYCALIALEVFIGFSGVLFSSYFDSDEPYRHKIPFLLVALGCISFLITFAIPLLKYTLRLNITDKIVKWVILTVWFIALATLIFVFIYFVYTYGFSFLMYKLL